MLNVYLISGRKGFVGSSVVFVKAKNVEQAVTKALEEFEKHYTGIKADFKDGSTDFYVSNMFEHSDVYFEEF